jgi:phospholipid N-methyltransferase
LRFWNSVSYQRRVRLEDAVRTDRILFGEFTPEEQQLYSEGVDAVTPGTAQALATSYDFGQHRRVLDLGGSTGSFLTAVLGRYSFLEVTLYDLPAVARATRQRLAACPLGDRIRIVEGDFFEDPIPEDHDPIIIANIVHCFQPEQVVALLRRVRHRVAEGARLVLVDFWTDETHTQPLFAALMAGEFLLTPGGGDVYSVMEGRRSLEETEWRAVAHTALAGPASMIVAETA